MRIVHLGTHDRIGGAARAHWRLHQALREAGVNSSLLVKHASGSDPTVRCAQGSRDVISRSRRWLRRRRFERQRADIDRVRPADTDGFDGDRAPWGADLLDQLPAPDVIHIHWVARYVDLPEFLPAAAKVAPVAWTLHDLNGLTGGCHYPRGCEGWRSGCRRCPQLSKDPESTLAAETWQRLHQAIAAIPAKRLQVVAASRWMAGVAEASPHFRGRKAAYIPHGLDIQAYAPRNRRFARDALGLPADAEIVLFVSDATRNPRKGLDVLTQAVARLKDRPRLLLVSLGQGAPPVVPGVNQQHLGMMKEDRWLSLAYSAADVFVIPSREEVFGQTMLESLACGTPVIGSDTGGIPDLVRPDETGLLFPPGDDQGLAQALRVLLDRPEKREAMGRTGRARVQADYSLAAYAQSHINLYHTLLA